MKNRVLSLLLLAWPMGLLSCQTAYFASEFHIEFDLRTHMTEKERLDVQSFHLVESVEPNSDSFEMAKLKHSIRNALLGSGLTESVDEGSADLIVFYDTNLWTEQQSGTLPLPTSTQTVGKIGGVEYSSSSWGIAFVPYTTTMSGRCVWLYALYGRGTSPQIMWKGFVGCEDHYFDDEKLRDKFLAHLTEMLLTGQTWML